MNFTKGSELIRIWKQKPGIETVTYVIEYSSDADGGRRHLKIRSSEKMLAAENEWNKIATITRFE